MSNITNIADIRDQLIEVFDGLRSGRIDAKEAIEVNNTAGKIINTAKVQLAYAALRGEVPYIPFLDTKGVPANLEATKAITEPGRKKGRALLRGR